MCNAYGWCDIGDYVLPRHGDYAGDVCEVTKIDGAYIYIHPVQESSENILQVYLAEIDLYEKYYERRERKIKKLLD
jgi:hypothetical protein